MLNKNAELKYVRKMALEIKTKSCLNCSFSHTNYCDARDICHINDRRVCGKYALSPRQESVLTHYLQRERALMSLGAK